MLKALSQRFLERSISLSYTKRFKQKGAQPEGVFWASKLTQIARFEHVLNQSAKAVDMQKPFRLTDIGCGYGALFEFINTTPRYHQIHYQGVDINTSFIQHCQTTFPAHKKQFSVGRQPQGNTDISVYVGTFNLCHTDDYTLWEDYIFTQIEKSWDVTRHAIALNMTALPEAKIRNNIFYVEPKRFAQKLRHYFGKTEFSATRYVLDDATFLIKK